MRIGETGSSHMMGPFGRRVATLLPSDDTACTPSRVSKIPALSNFVPRFIRRTCWLQTSSHSDSPSR